MEKERKPVGGSAAVLVRRGGICPRRQETGKEEKRKGEKQNRRIALKQLCERYDASYD